MVVYDATYVDGCYVSIGSPRPACPGGDAVSDTLFPLEPDPAPVRSRPRNPVWDALAEVFGDPTTESNTRLRGRITRSLATAGATPEEIMRRAAAWPFHFPGAVLTETALERHWDRLGRPVLRGSDADVARAMRRLRIVGGGE